MNENVEKFINEAAKNEELKNKLSVLLDKESDVDKIIELAGKYGYDLKAEDFATPPAGELSLDDLDAVAGGGLISNIRGALKKLQNLI